MRVVNQVGAKYALQDLIMGKIHDAHISRLSEYLFDENDTSFTPHDAARRDNHEYWVEAILNHKGHQSNKTAMTFEVQWRGAATATWELWSNVRLTEPLHEYLRTHKMKSIIPKNLQA